MCIPGSEILSNQHYKDIVSDTEKVDQIAQILIRYNKLPQSIIEGLCFVIPRIDAWDFAKYRDGQVELRFLRGKVLGVPKDWSINMEDINAKVAEYERALKLQSPEYRNSTSLMPQPLSHSQTLASFATQSLIEPKFEQFTGYASSVKGGSPGQGKDPMRKISFFKMGSIPEVPTATEITQITSPATTKSPRKMLAHSKTQHMLST